MKPTTAEGATKAQLQWKLDLPVDWDNASNIGKLLFLVVNATTEPTQLSGVASSIADGGFCGVPYRLFAGGWDTASQAGLATPSDTGSKTDASTQLVVYGLREGIPGVPLPVGWTFGSVCDGHQNAAQMPGMGLNVCLPASASMFGLARLAEIDDWQFSVVQGGLQPPSLRKRTWWNGLGTPGQTTTCASGSICPTRAFFAPNPHGSAGYGWGGVYAETHEPYLDQVAPWDGLAETMLRNHAHEYFHGLGSTWWHATDYPHKGTNWGNAYVSEPFATTAEPSACITNYPTDAAAGFNPPPDKCVSSRTLYGPFYIRGGLLSANSYLQFPENPLETYPGVLFYRYAAAQFAYPYNKAGQLAHLPTAQTNSVSPVRYRPPPNQFEELPLNDRRPDEGMDLLGYILSTLPETNAPSLHCNASLSSEASILDRISCVLEHYVGRTFEDMLLEFHTMLVLKDYVDTDPRWRLEWLGDYNDGAAQPIFTSAPAPVGIKS